jgi:putative addiction module component (TIGR02574 family)
MHGEVADVAAEDDLALVLQFRGDAFGSGRAGGRVANTPFGRFADGRIIVRTCVRAYLCGMRRVVAHRAWQVVSSTECTARPRMNAKLQELPLDERIKLVEDLWDSIAADQKALPLTPAQRVELDRRLDAYEIDKNRGRRASEVLAYIRRRL